MSDQAPEVVQGQSEPDVTQTDTGTPASGTDESGNDNLYAQYLEKFPESLHPLATEVFKEWDGNVTKKLQQVHSEYEPYKPVIDAYEADALQQAIRLAESLETNPQQFIEAVIKHYGIDLDTQQQGQEFIQPNQPDPTQQQQYQGEQPTPEQIRLDQQEQLLRAIAESMVAQREEQQQLTQMQQEEALYEQTMTDLRTKYGQFDEVYVNSLLAQGVDPNLAVQHWRSQVETFAKQALTPNTNAPTVMSAGGGTPSVQRDVAELSSKETRQLVEQMLAAAAAENQGN